MKSYYIVLLLIMGFSCKNADNPESIQKNEKEFKESAIKDDITFIGAVGQENLLEIHLAQLAQGKALDKVISRLGKTVETDFINDMEDLKPLASKRSINLPASYNEAYRKVYQMVAHKHKEHFDRSYMDHLVDSYKDKIEQYKKEASEGKDPLIQQWAAERIPLLQSRLQNVEAVRRELK